MSLSTAILEKSSPKPQGTTRQSQELKKRSFGFESQACEIGQQARRSFRKLRSLPRAKRDGALLRLAEGLQEPPFIKRILKANKADIAAAASQGLRPGFIDRLRLDQKGLRGMATALKEIVALPDPLGEVLQGTRLPNGIDLIQRRVPLGVVFTIYESRPNVTIDVGALCIKSGNCAILRGGKEAFHTNLALFELFREAMNEQGLPLEALQFVQETDRAFMLALLRQEAWIDLVVPRGGEALIRFISENSRIPVVKHDKGVCNFYVDSSADLEQAAALAINAKLQRTSVCNAIENLIIHKDFPKTAELLEKLVTSGAKLLGCERSAQACSQVKLIPEQERQTEYAAEYLDERLSVKIVDDMDEALDFIFQYGSGHSEAIAARDIESIRYFQENVDTAAVFINCSTRFHDGGQMGFGAEVGISTGRLHVRGPMALKDLSTTTFILSGSGQVRP